MPPAKQVKHLECHSTNIFFTFNLGDTRAQTAEQSLIDMIQICSPYQILKSTDIQPKKQFKMYVNSATLSWCHPHFRKLTRRENVVQYHPLYFEVRRLESTEYEIQNFL